MPRSADLQAALRVERSERTGFAGALDDDSVLGDVPQTTVKFHHDRVACPAASGSAIIVEQLALVAAIIGEPQEHVRPDRVDITLDLMNVNVPTGGQAAADTLKCKEMLIGTRRRMTLEMRRFPSDHLLPMVDFRGEARRALSGLAWRRPDPHPATLRNV